MHSFQKSNLPSLPRQERHPRKVAARHGKSTFFLEYSRPLLLGPLKATHRSREKRSGALPPGPSHARAHSWRATAESVEAARHPTHMRGNGRGEGQGSTGGPHHVGGSAPYAAGTPKRGRRSTATVRRCVDAAASRRAEARTSSEAKKLPTSVS